MCYDISFTVNIEELADYYPGLKFDDDQLEIGFGPFDHIQGPGLYSPHPIVHINREDFQPHCKMMEWSCLEFYLKEEPNYLHRNGRLNIRSEKILDDKRSYWYKIRNRRCLVPVTAIYEHREVKGWPKKVPYYIRPKDADKVFFLPGLYSVAELPDKKTGDKVKRPSFGIITRVANSVMKNIHNSGDNGGRMPLFLPPELSKIFISEELTEKDYRELLNFELPAEELYYHPVNTIRTPKPRPDGKAKHEQWEWENLPVLGEANPD